MATFRTQDHVPDVYTRKSRDFQLFCNLFDCVNGGIKYDIDSILDIVDTNQCNERLLPYLQTKIGFWTKVKISAENLRIILKGFMYAVRNKGSITGVERAVQIFLKIAKIDTNVHIEVINESETQEPYTIIIGTEERLGDTTILDEILKYIIPAGYNYRYMFYADTSFETPIQYADSVNVVTGSQSLLGAVRTTFIDEEGNEIEYPVQYTTTDEATSKTRIHKDIIGSVNQTVISSNKVPLSASEYDSADEIRDPESTIVNDKVVTKKEDIDELYRETKFEDD